jgi:hypothetical protein
MIVSPMEWDDWVDLGFATIGCPRGWAANHAIVKRQAPSLAAARRNDIDVIDQPGAAGPKKRDGLSVWRKRRPPVAELLRWRSYRTKRRISQRIKSNRRPAKRLKMTADR